MKYNHPIVEKRIRDKKSINGVIVLGSSCSGKTTLINSLRNNQCGIIDIPKRFITRVKRQNDDHVENKHLSHEEFERYVQEELINVCWQRDLGQKKAERYGFSKKEEFSIFSANNAILKDNNKLSPQDFIKENLIIGIYVPDKERNARMKKRSPDLFESSYKKELNIRQGDLSSNIIEHSDIIIRNYGYSIDEIMTEFNKLIDGLVKNEW